VSKKRKDKRKIEQPQKDFITEKVKKQITFKQKWTSILTAIITEVMTAAIIIVFSSGISNVILGDLPNQVDKLNEADNVRKADIAELKTDIKTLQKEIATLTGNMDIIKGALFTKCDLSGSSLSAKPLTTIDDNTETGAGPGWMLDDIVASDFVSGKSYKTKDLINKQVLMPYKEDGDSEDDWSVIIKKKQGDKYESEKYTYHKNKK